MFFFTLLLSALTAVIFVNFKKFDLTLQQKTTFTIVASIFTNVIFFAVYVFVMDYLDLHSSRVANFLLFPVFPIAVPLLILKIMMGKSHK